VNKKNKIKPIKASKGKVTKINGGKKAMAAQVKNLGVLARQGMISVREAVKQINLIQDKLLGKKKVYGGVNKVNKVNKVKKVMKGLQKASKSHAKQAKVLKSVLKNGKKRS
tara:strand:+ start:768 stop:1100 length:333 start_codon:yes stop_codon:yes gene_type:complete